MGRVTNSQTIYRAKPPIRSTEEPCTCKDCGKTFISRIFLKRHKEGMGCAARSGIK